MVKSVRATIETRSARSRLAARKEPYWVKLERGLGAGYYRSFSNSAGTWHGRALVAGRYRSEVIGTADDHFEANGVTILNWSQAQAAVRAWAAKQTSKGPTTVEAAIMAYVDDLRARRSARAADEALGRMRKHLLPALGARPLADLSAADLSTWRNGLVDRDGDEDKIRKSRDTANRLWTIVRATLNHAFHNGKVADDRAWRRVKAFKGVGEARKIILTESEEQRLIDACGPGLQELALAGALTGARLGELIAAHVRDFDADAAILTVSGKTGSRPIHLPPTAVTLFRRLASGRRPQDYLLTTATGGRWARGSHLHPFALAVARAGLDPDVTFYALRHTWISRALVAGVPTKAAAVHCGTSVIMIERYYAKFIPSDQERYAALAAPALRIDAGQKIAPLRPGAAG